MPSLGGHPPSISTKSQIHDSVPAGATPIRGHNSNPGVSAPTESHLLLQGSNLFGCCPLPASPTTADKVILRTAPSDPTALLHAGNYARHLVRASSLILRTTWPGKQHYPHFEIKIQPPAPPILSTWRLRSHSALDKKTTPNIPQGSTSFCCFKTTDTGAKQKEKKK